MSNGNMSDYIEKLSNEMENFKCYTLTERKSNAKHINSIYIS